MRIFFLSFVLTLNFFFKKKHSAPFPGDSLPHGELGQREIVRTGEIKMSHSTKVSGTVLVLCCLMTG